MRPGAFERAAELEANNFAATEKIAAACREAGARLIHLSSTSVYGSQNALVSEDCTLDELKPQSPYATTKLKEEELVQSLAKSRGLKAIVFRFGTIFGASAGMRYHTAVNKFCWQAVMRQPLSIWNGAYEQKRPYLDLVDAVRAIAFVIKQDLFDGRVYNVLTLNATVRNIVECIREFVPDVQLSFVNSPIMNQLSYEVSCERFRDRGFTFAGDIRRGIGETVASARGRQPRLAELYVHAFGNGRRGIHRRQFRRLLAAFAAGGPDRHPRRTDLCREPSQHRAALATATFADSFTATFATRRW